MVINGASVSVDGLETSINKTAPLEAIFLKIVLDFEKCRNAPFW